MIPVRRSSDSMPRGQQSLTRPCITRVSLSYSNLLLRYSSFNYLDVDWGVEDVCQDLENSMISGSPAGGQNSRFFA